MNIIGFYHSLASDWNHGNAHFLRGITTDLLHRGHNVAIYEEFNNWSLQHLAEEAGAEPLTALRDYYPLLRPRFYLPSELELDALLADADAVIVHEWTPPALIKMIGDHHKASPHYVLLFHDTHHRAVSVPEEMSNLDLSGYDGALVFGEILRQRYLENKWIEQAWTWHEAADTRVFRPLPRDHIEGDVVWIGNWGDEERTAELHEFLLEPVKNLNLSARVHGVRYPDSAKEALHEAGIEYAGWLPNFRAPEVFARFRMTVHVPRRYYRESLPGIPTIRPFEAMACGIPLISAPWEDAEHLFSPGSDFLVAHDREEMERHLYFLKHQPQAAAEMAQRAFDTIRSRHTCRHRVDELIQIIDLLKTQRQANSARRISQTAHA
ncbi:MAG: a-glycosyltransferase [Puniceicoccaceae bacterium 5H]|nr:MAG: a-glycosyltransferase [Puniceicoccaceae bacterium 5H]